MTENLYRNWRCVTSDNYSIVCHHWSPPPGVESKARILILHGIQSHAGWYQKLAESLAEQGVEVLMPDRRGSGQNIKDRGFSNSSRRLIQDIVEITDAWNNLAKNSRQPILAGISWGGKLAAATCASHEARFSGLALIAPGLFAVVRPPIVQQLFIAICALFLPKRQFEIPLSDPSLFTQDPVWQKFIRTDPNTLHQATARFFVVSRVFDLRLKRIRKRLSLPILLQVAGLDRIVNNRRTVDYVSVLPSKSKTIVEYPGAHHTLEFEPEEIRQKYTSNLIEWILAQSRTDSPG